MKTYRLSPSNLNLMRDCLRCFWHHYNGLKRPSGLFPSLPSGMDVHIKQYFDAYRSSGRTPPEVSRFEDTKLFQDTKLVNLWRNWRTGLSWKDEQGNTLSGAVDDVMQRDGKLVVLDYKTKGSEPTSESAIWYEDQLAYYTLLLQKNGYETWDYGLLLFYYPAMVNMNGKVVFHTTLLRVLVDPQRAERNFRQAIEILNQPMPEPNKNCEYCKYRR